MINLNKKQNKMKNQKSTDETMPTQPALKLIDILRQSKETSEEIAITAQAEQGNINTQQEILDIKGKINAQTGLINAALNCNPFSATMVFAARKEKQLLEMKLKGLQDIQAELF